MSNQQSRDVVKKTYLTPAEAAQLSEWASEAGKSESALLREALLEYLDRDRTARVESKVDELADEIAELRATLSDGDTHTHKDGPPMNQGTSAVEKARKMVRRLRENHGEVIKNEDVERAIEDYAGIDDRTIRKYKQQFKRRGTLFEHPGDRPVWTPNSEMWFDWIHDYASLNGTDDAEEIVADYPATVSPKMDGGFFIELVDAQ